jgi:Kinesin motor domain
MDLVFGCDKAFYGGTQQELYEEILHLPLLHALDGFSALVMLCGQKGTGKTYTSRGEDKNYDCRGLIPRVIEELFRQIQLCSHQYDIRVRYASFNVTLMEHFCP